MILLTDSQLLQAGAPCEGKSEITTSSRFAGTTKAAERTVLKDKRFTQPDRRSTPQYAEDSEDEEFHSADEGDKYSHLKDLSGYLGTPQVSLSFLQLQEL